MINALSLPHRVHPGGDLWRLTPGGVAKEGGETLRTPGPPRTIRRIWRAHQLHLRDASRVAGVPLELLLATVATESGGDVQAVRFEPGYISDHETPHQVSAGLCQLLLSTAREALGDPELTREELHLVRTNLMAAAWYINKQARRETLLDPVLVAAAYNAGGLYRQRSRGNWTRLRQWPIGSSEHVDRFLGWYGDAVTVVATAVLEEGVVHHVDLLAGLLDLED